MNRNVFSRILVIWIAFVVCAGAWIYSRRPRQRIPSQEGIESPEVARAYNRISRLPQMELLRRYVVRRALGLKAQGEAADLGCGPGYLVFRLAAQAPGLRITGVDLSDEMLAEAETQARRAGVAGRVRFKKGDVQRLPFPDASLDLVVSTLSLHHWSQPVAVLDEVARVLRPDGACLIFDIRRDLAAPFYMLFWFATHVVVPRALRWANEPLNSRHAAYTPEEAAELAQQSRLTGWRIVQGPLWLIIERPGA
ncbi:MAG: class I SAM-dependent methyltransferase [Chloroflexi bacterium]|nr:class I SAM-dependent methyltransferase [Chloroflexota bacterium]